MHTDGLEGGRGQFSLCSFWFVECLTRAGRLDEAAFLPGEDVLLRHTTGTLREEIGHSGEALGNFPHASPT